MDAHQNTYDLELRRAAKDFWLSSGHILLDVTQKGRLALTDAFLKAYLARPELMPPPEACAAERALHKKLMTAPAAAVYPAEIAAIGDADARENWVVMLSFREILLNSETIEEAYLALASGGAGQTPPLFLSQLVHAIARQAFTGCPDPRVLRAGELLFRAQRVTVHDGGIMLADDEVLEQRRLRIASTPLLQMFAGETAHMDVLNAVNAESYWSRSDRFDTILEFGALDGGRSSFAEALSLWIRHLFGFTAKIEPIARIDDLNVRWLLGLDAEATALGNAIWRGEALKPEDTARLVAFFRIAPDSQLPFREDVLGHPVYLLLAMDKDRIIRVKPQNLVTGLPLREGR